MNDNRRVSIRSLLPLLKMKSGGRSDLDTMLPELGQMALFAERKIGLNVANMKVEKGKVNIKNNMALLPEDFYSLQDINICRLSTNRGLNYTGNLSECSCGGGQACSCGYMYYKQNFIDFYVDDCYLRAPFKEGEVHFNYYALPLDGEGLPLINEGHAEAIMQYWIMNFKEGELNMGTIQPHQFNMNKVKWEEQAVIARAQDNVPTREEVAMFARVTNDRYKFRAYGSGSNWLGYY